ncbi:MAG: DUF5815 family protein [Halodesulfurarchaeum sp.]
MTAQPGVPTGPSGQPIELPCGETIQSDDLDLGLREYRCDCGETHAVVLDPHPPSRFLPESVTEVLAETLAAEGTEMSEFGMVPLMGLVMDAYPEQVVAHDASEDGSTGYAAAWIADFDAREFHEIVVRTVLEVMAQAVTAVGDDSAADAFSDVRADFDVEEFVEEYRSVRDFEDEFDEPA